MMKTVVTMGSRDGAIVRACASHQCSPGWNPRPGHNWVDFCVGSHPCSEDFSRSYPVSFSPQDPIRSGNSGQKASPWDVSLQFPIINLLIHLLIQLLIVFIYMHLTLHV